jgi:hypothetical protein
MECQPNETEFPECNFCGCEIDIDEYEMNGGLCDDCYADDESCVCKVCNAVISTNEYEENFGMCESCCNDFAE